MVISVQRCKKCGRKFQYYEGAAIPEQQICSRCATAVILSTSIEDDDETRITYN